MAKIQKNQLEKSSIDGSSFVINPFPHTRCKPINWVLSSFVKEVTREQAKTTQNNLERPTTYHFITGAVMQFFLRSHAYFAILVIWNLLKER